MVRESRKIAVIGAGNVGATCAFVMAERKLGDIVLLDMLTREIHSLEEITSIIFKQNWGKLQRRKNIHRRK